MSTRPVAPADRAAPSVRLLQVLRTYCGGIDAGGVDDLRAALLRGQYPWLQGELAGLVSDGRDVSGWWRLAVGQPDLIDGAPPSDGRAELRVLWSRLFAEIPFPAPDPRGHTRGPSTRSTTAP